MLLYSLILCVCVFVSAFNLDNEQPDYDMDSEDETLLNRLNRKMEIKPLQFEIMIDRLEKASSSQVSCCAKKWLSYFSFLVGWLCFFSLVGWFSLVFVFQFIVFPGKWVRMFVRVCRTTEISLLSLLVT